MAEDKKKGLEFRDIRRGFKKNAHRVVRSHYVFLLIVSLLLIIMGNEFQLSTEAFNIVDEGKVKKDSAGVVTKSGTSDMVDELIGGNLEQSKKKTEKEMKEIKKKSSKTSVLGRSHGIFATAANSISSGNFAVNVILAIRNVVHSGQAAIAVFILLALLVWFLIWLFLSNMLGAVVRRLFLEARQYEKVEGAHFVWFLTVHRWVRVSLAMFLKTVYLALWGLTIVGFFIKVFSYYMVPFIIAENPDIKPREAILLSRKMMDGHKLEALKLEITMLGWTLLGILTFGLSELVYGVPYRLAVESEYYNYVRGVTKAEFVEGTERLNDEFLFRSATKEEIQSQYKSVKEKNESIEARRMPLVGIKKFFSDNFGIWLGSIQEKLEYQAIEEEAYGIRREVAAAKGVVYPDRLNPLYDEKKGATTGNFSFLRSYTIWSLIIMFFIFSVGGWIWEVSLHLVNHGTFVNRGMMQGPWLPIYGNGAILILVTLNRLRKSPVAEFLAAIVVSGILEYSTSLFLEVTKGMRWWDYSGYFLNLNGRICAEGLLVFGLGGMAVVYILAPLLDKLISKLPPNTIRAIAIVLVGLYGADFLYSRDHPNLGKGITS